MIVFALAATGSNVPSVGMTVRAVGGMLLVLGLVALLAWLARRGTLRFPGQQKRLPVRIESATPLGDRRSLVIVSVEGRRLLLGTTPMQVSLVTELSPGPHADFTATLDAKVSSPEGPRA